MGLLVVLYLTRLSLEDTVYFLIMVHRGVLECMQQVLCYDD